MRGIGRTHVEICVARTFGGTFEERRLFPFLPLLTSDPRASSASNGPKSYPLRTCHHQKQHIDGVERNGLRSRDSDDGQESSGAQ